MDAITLLDSKAQSAAQEADNVAANIFRASPCAKQGQAPNTKLGLRV